MRASGANDSTYTKRPGWSVGRRATAPDALSPDPLAKLSLSTRKRVAFTASVVVGAALAVFAWTSAQSIGGDPDTTAPAHDKNNARITIDDEPIALPQNGHIHRTYTNQNNQSTIDIRVQSPTTD